MARGFRLPRYAWEPARALLDGAAIYPAPTRDSIVLGNPTVYPPVFIVASVPLALIPVGAASWLWFGLLGACVFAALWVLAVRDWRCYIVALTSPVVVHGLFSGTSRSSSCSSWRSRGGIAIVQASLGSRSELRWRRSYSSGLSLHGCS